jgi:hypothetical protein
MYIFLQTDGFHETVKKAQTGITSVRTSYNTCGVRRPYRGIQIKDDTYAVLSVRKPDGSAIPMVSSSSVSGTFDGAVGTVNDYSDFILQRVEDQRMEKQQIIETFGDVFVYFFGERPRIVTISGMLMNTDDFNWRAQFWHNYENYLRGTKLVEMNARCYLAYDTVVLEGYPISANAVDDANEPYNIPFQMAMILTNYYDYSKPGTIKFPGVEADTLLALNLELDLTRSEFVSTGAEVRGMNLRAQGPAGVLAMMRQGIRAYNDVVGQLGAGFDTFKDLVYGRAVRLPVGIAGFIAANTGGEEALAAGSVATTDTVMFDAKTGAYVNRVEGIPIGYKLKMAGPAKFAPGWVSEVTGKSRGVIYENYDEYPKQYQPESLSDLVKPDKLLEWAKADAQRVATAKAEDLSLATLNALAETGGALGSIADMIDFTKSAFGMASTAVADAGNLVSGFTAAIQGLTPTNILNAGVGLLNNFYSSGVYIGQALGDSLAALKKLRFAGPTERLFQSGDTDVGASTLGEVYQSSNYKSTTLLPTGFTKPGAADVVYTQPSEQSVDEVYNSNSYRSQTTATQDNNYESAYADADYAAMMAQQQAADQAAAAGAEATAAGLVSGNAASLQAALNTAYGDVDLSKRPSVAGHPIEVPTEAEVSEVYAASDYQAVTQGLQPVDVVTLYGPSDEAQALLIAQSLAKAAALSEDPPPSSEVIFGAQDIETARLGAALAKTAARWATEITPDSLEAVFSAVGTLQQRKLTDDEIAVLLQLAYGSSYTNPPDDSNRSGITAVEDDSAPIKPSA